MSFMVDYDAGCLAPVRPRRLAAPDSSLLLHCHEVPLLPAARQMLTARAMLCFTGGGVFVGGVWGVKGQPGRCSRPEPCCASLKVGFIIG